MQVYGEEEVNRNPETWVQVGYPNLGADTHKGIDLKLKPVVKVQINCVCEKMFLFKSTWNLSY